MPFQEQSSRDQEALAREYTRDAHVASTEVQRLIQMGSPDWNKIRTLKAEVASHLEEAALFKRYAAETRQQEREEKQINAEILQLETRLRQLDVEEYAAIQRIRGQIQQLRNRRG